MPDESQPRSVKIGADERTGWSSERPRTDGRPARPPDVSVRCRVLSPTDRLHYAPGSLLVVVAGSPVERDDLIARVIEGASSALSLDKVRGLLAGRVEEAQVEARALELLDAAILKRLEAGETVVVGADGVDPDERERYVRLAARFRRPRHLIFLEVARDRARDEDRPALNELRRALDAGELGAEGFHTALRLGGKSASELKRIVFRPEPQAD